MIRIAASVMCADIFNLERDILQLKEAGVDYLHVDIMDGQFVNNITLGLDCCKQLKKYSLPRDIHLLVQYPQQFVESFDLGEGDILQAHREASFDIIHMAELVHSLGAKFGIALNPETPVESIEEYLPAIDVVTLMMIRPGFAGRQMEEGMIEKILRTRKWLDSKKHERIIIEADGHVNSENISQMYVNGASIFVAGSSSVFQNGTTIKDGVDNLRKRGITL